MRFPRLTGFIAALALLVPIAALADVTVPVTYPVTNPTYTPTALMNPSITATATNDWIFPASGLNSVSVRIQLSAGSVAGNIQGTNSPLSGTPVWTNLQMLPVAGGSIVTSFAAAGFWQVNTAGLSGVRVHVTTLSGGTMTLNMAGTNAPAGVTLINTSAVSGTVQIDQGTPGTTNGVVVTTALPAGTNGIGKLTANSGVDIGDVTLTAGSALIGSAGIDQTTPGTTNAVVGTLVATGGASMAHVISTASTNSQLIGSAAAHSLFGVYAVNTNAATAYLKFYNKATGPTCASDTVLMTVPLVQNIPVNMNLSPAGAAFALGIGVCITGAQADNDNTNATTGITVSAIYK